MYATKFRVAYGNGAVGVRLGVARPNVGDGVDVRVALTKWGVSVGVCVTVGVNVGTNVGVGVSVGVGVGVGVEVEVGVGVGVGTCRFKWITSSA